MKFTVIFGVLNSLEIKRKYFIFFSSLNVFFMIGIDTVNDN